jgi:hypothetical protein
LKKGIIFSTLCLVSISNALNIKERGIDLSLGDTKVGQSIFSRYIRFDCNISYIKFAIIHTQNEWEDIAQAGKFEEEIFRVCPKITKKYAREWTPHLYQFAYYYAIDSGNIPSY